MQIEHLEKKALQHRKTIMEILYNAGSGHPGGSLSAAEVVTALYYEIMNVDPKNPKDPDRDRFIMSKGHACPIQYVCLADLGYFPEEDLMTLRKIDSHLQGHPDMHKTPGIDISTGSLGQGLSIGLGMALCAKLDKKDYQTYVVLGDGEIQEGSVWEAAMAASYHKADNLTGILDFNGLQLDGRVKDIMDLGDISAKWKAFGWNVQEIDGHNMKSVVHALENAKNNDNGRPNMIIANTVKGKGVKCLENQVSSHGSPVSKEVFDSAMVDFKGDNK